MRHSWFVGMLLVLGCRGSTSPTDDLVVTASVDRPVFRLGETVTVVVAVTNRGMRPRTINTRFCSVLPFVVTTLAGEEVGPNVTGGCLLYLETKTLAPGEQFEFRTPWAGRARRQDPADPATLPPGTYLLRGRPVSAGSMQSDPVTIQITP